MQLNEVASHVKIVKSTGAISNLTKKYLGLRQQIIQTFYFLLSFQQNFKTNSN